MKRRSFLALAGSAAAFPRIALAQGVARPLPRIAVLCNVLSDALKQAIIQGLADFGYVNGKTISVEFLVAPTIADVPAYAARAVASNPDLILTLQSAAPLALRNLATNIPVVFTNINDPVAIGAVASYARPGGNMTGNMNAGTDFVGKQFAIIRETMPGLKRLAVFGLPADPPYPVLLAQVRAATKAANIEMVLIETKEGDPFPPLFDRALQGGAEAVYVIVAGYLSNLPNAATLADLALQNRLPAFGRAQDAQYGFLLGYGSRNLDIVRQSGSYVDAILKGATPADMPVEQPSVFDLVVNMKTAQALGLAIPQSILFQATQVIS